MVTRRSLIILAGYSAVANALAQQTVQAKDDPLPPLPGDLAGAAGEDDYFSTQLDMSKLGSVDPGDKKREFAREIMDAAPLNCRPIDVAYYFRDLGLGKTKFKEEGRPYARGWPHFYNPVIIELFTATHTNPLSPNLDGDETPWCAAFVNFCIVRSRSKSPDDMKNKVKEGTGSASSGSFRCFGSPVDVSKVKEGDIVVWALEGTVNGCNFGKGHVGFFAAHTDNANLPFLVMGGNQSGDLLTGVAARKDGAFLKAMPRRYPANTNASGVKVFKELYGFRTDPRL